MKCFVLLSLCALSLAKPQGKLVTETEGRIIGGEEAPKRKLRKIKKKLVCRRLARHHQRIRVYFNFNIFFQMSFPGRCLSKASGLTFVAAL